MKTSPLESLRHHVTGAIERGEATAVVAIPAAARRWVIHTTHHAIDMTLIGYWDDLAAYYSGSDGNVWKFQSMWVCMGNEPTFRSRFSARRYRGTLFA